jgi:hypothetical protein
MCDATFPLSKAAEALDRSERREVRRAALLPQEGWRAGAFKPLARFDRPSAAGRRRGKFDGSRRYKIAVDQLEGPRLRLC